MSTPTQAGGTSPTVPYATPNTAGEAGQGEQGTTALPAAKTPVGPGAATVVGSMLAVLLVGLGLAGVHDALVAAGTAAGTPWIDAVVKAFNGLRPDVWLVPAGFALVLLGLWLISAALRPRRRTAIALNARTGVFLRPRDVAKLARNAAQDVDGVTSAKVTAGRRKVAVAARATTTAGMEQKIIQAVTARLQTLAKAPRVRVTVKTEGDT